MVAADKDKSHIGTPAKRRTCVLALIRYRQESIICKCVVAVALNK